MASGDSFEPTLGMFILGLPLLVQGQGGPAALGAYMRPRPFNSI
jgi:hypothetical protein